MKVIFNHTLRSIRASKGQLAVIILTVAVVTMLFFATLTVGDLFYNFQVAGFSRLSGDAEIAMDGAIFSGEKLNEFLSENQDKVEYVDKYLRMTGLLNTEGEDEVAKSTAILMEITDLDEFLSRHKGRLSYSDGIKSDDSYVYPAIWISEGLAKKNGYEVGQEVDIYVSFFNRYQKFTVAYIFEDKGVFANSTIYNVFADSTELGEKGLYTTAYFKLKESVNQEQFITDLATFMDVDGLEVDYAVDYDYVNNLVSDNQSLLNVALVFILALVIFILFSAYKVVMRSRAQEMTVFKAAGATPTQTVMILLFEGAFYGIVGAIIGVIVGRFIMQAIVMSVIPNFAQAVNYEFSDYILSFVLGILMSLISALFPILKLTRDTVRNLNTGSVRELKKLSPYLLIPGAIGIIVCVVLTIFVPGYELLFTILMLVSAVAIIIVGAPYLTMGISKLFNGGITTKLPSSNVKRNGDAVTLSSMLGAIVAFTFIAVSIVNVIIEASNPYNARFSSDYAIEAIATDVNFDEVNEIVSNTYGVEYSYLFRYDTFDVDLNGEIKDVTVYAVDNADALSCATTSLTDKEKELFNNDERSAVFTYDMLNRLDLRVGDKVKLTFDGKECEFIICAMDDTRTNTDRIIYVNTDGLQLELKESLILIGTSKNVSNSDLYLDLRGTLEEKGCYILSYQDWAYASSVGVKGLGTLLRALEILIIAVGMIGIVNMILTLFIKRDREFGIYRAVGMDDKSFVIMLLGEGLIISLVGGVIGFILSMIINLLVPNFARLIDRYISLTPFPTEVLVIIAMCIVIFTIVYTIIGSRYRISKRKIERNIS